jgi:hypothetical protein
MLTPVKTASGALLGKSALRSSRKYRKAPTRMAKYLRGAR